MRQTVWLFIVWLCHNHNSNGSMEVVMSIDNTTYTNYTAECVQRPDFEDPDVLAAMKRRMMNQGITKVWLPIRKESLGRWEWLSGEFYKLYITSPEWSQPGLDCGLLRSKTQLIDDDACITNQTHYACQAKGQCNPNTANHLLCFEQGVSSFYIYKETGNWYYAKDRCTDRNQTLAVFTQAERGVILDKISKTLVHDIHMWIGLRQRDYFLHLGRSEKRLLRKHHWNQKELCHCPEKNCALSVRSQAGDFWWRQEHCDLRHAFFCMQKVTSAKQASSKPWWFKEYYWLIIIAAGCLGGALLIIIITAIWCCCHSRQKRIKHEKKRQEEHVALVEPASKTSTPTKQTPPVPAPRKKPPKASQESLEQVGQDGKEGERALLMNKSDRKGRPRPVVVYKKGEEVPPPYSPRVAPDGEDDAEDEVEEKKRLSSGRPQYTDEEILAFRKQKKMTEQKFEWIMWSLADAVANIRPLKKRAELFDLLNVEHSVCSFTVRNEDATGEDFYPLLQYWYKGKKIQKAWKDIQRIIQKEYNDESLISWMDEINAETIV